MTAARAGAAPVLGELYERHAPAIERFISRWGGFHAEDARDLTQDVFVKAGIALPRMLARQAAGGWFDPRPWLYRIATNVCIDRGRRDALVRFERWDGPRGRGQLEHLHPRAPWADDPEAVALQRAEVADLVGRLARARGAMPERERAVLALAAGLAARGRLWPTGNDGAYAEIATALGTGVPAVKSLLGRARVRLRREPQERQDGSQREGT